MVLQVVRSGGAWITHSELIRSPAGLAEYTSWDLPQAAARTYPATATLDELVMLMKWFALAFLFDDQVDTNKLDRVTRVGRISRELSAVTHRPAGSPPDPAERCPITTAFAAVWTDLSTGMRRSWIDRFRSSWGEFLAAHADEVRIEAIGEDLRLNVEQYLELRRRSVGIYHSLDAAERACHVEVPRRWWRILRGRLLGPLLLMPSPA